MTERTWSKLTATVKTEQLQTVCAVMSMLDNGLMIEDYSDFSCNGMYGELVDEAILCADRNTARVSIFVPQERSVVEYTAFLRERFAANGIEATLSVEGLREEDWSESWKQYYRPVHIGRLSVVPSWETYEKAEDEVVVRMDPGMAFGTGTHETTRLVLRLTERHLVGGERFLDIGCGSGILSVCAAKLGASFCAAYDIDPVAVEVTKENIRESGEKNIICGVSDLLSGVKRVPGGYDFCVANIVADTLLRMLPDIGAYLSDKATLVLSGIIEPRACDIEAALAEHGFRVKEKESENDWVALLAEKE